MDRTLHSVLVVTAALACAVGCRDIPAPRDIPDTPANPLGLIVSAPVPVSSSTAGSGAPTAPRATGGASSVYVSLPPGSVPRGMGATITNQVTGLSVTTAIVGGGFDPVALAANVGDTVRVAITGAAAMPSPVQLIILPHRPVRVVRTSPPAGGRDVPLNSIMVIVFSGPIDPATVTMESVQLWQGTTPVAGTVRFADASQVRVELHPASLLATQTGYRLLVSQAIHDVNGVALAARMEVPFTTGATVQGAAKLAFTVQPTYPTVGSAISPAIVVAIQDSTGDTVTSAMNAVTLGLGANPTGATLAGTLTVTAVNGMAAFTHLTLDRAGSYTLVATADALTQATSNTFLVFAGGGTFEKISAGGAHTCGVTYEGAAYCWGSNDRGQLGDGTTNDRTSPVLVDGGLSLSLVVAGDSHTCGVTIAGAAYCWGHNDHGQLGDGTTTDRTSPVLVAGGLTFWWGISAGGDHNCGVTPSADLDEGMVYCWGSNASGQLGDGTRTDRTTPQRIAIASLVLVSAGGQHTCGLDRWATALDYCWGLNTSGQLDDETVVDRTSPVTITTIRCGSGPPGFEFSPGLTCPIGAMTPFEEITAGESHTCAEAGGSYFLSFAWYCWGANGNGQLGDGTTTDRTGPALVEGGHHWFQVSAGGRHTCGTARGGSGGITDLPAIAYCWGLNDHGQLGDGTTIQRTNPTLIAGGLTFLSLSAGRSHTCGVTAGAAYCWGSNSSGQLGDGTTTGSNVPVKIAGQP